MRLNNQEIENIVKTKYPFECNVLRKESYDPARMFTDNLDNYIVLEENEEVITVTFLNSNLSPQEFFERKNEGTFFLSKNFYDLQKLIELNLVFYNDFNLENSI